MSRTVSDAVQIGAGANRMRLIPLRGFHALITVHPSYLLRLEEERDKRREFEFLVRDLRVAASAARKART